LYGALSQRTSILVPAETN